MAIVLDRDALLREAAANNWWHTIDFGDGNASVGKKSKSLITAEADAIFRSLDLKGCSVLDVGAWDGFYSFEAKKRGASRVLATDHFIWTEHPHARRNFEIARELTGLDIEDRVIGVQDICIESVGQFDYVFFFGVFYHLLDPISAIQSLSKIAKKGLIVETQMALNFLPWPAMRFYPTTELLNDPTNWWAPNRACVAGLLQASGFERVTYRRHPKSRRGNRGIFHAFKSPLIG
ncbi:class I SAM-dependent methyltransferase [Bradyrhizobium prioriisuperbiae]|uniref:class I SAM-dependent methyltransferase n=1 Tax=Bradyrhizobium prioriisuperbiae TaxID=2854389 RepID=UPI0028EF6B91|nr:DUF1698 domain-containing protein [Bradyrhizobium prioritasuperba]